MEGLRPGGGTGYGAQPSIGFKAQVRTADMEIQMSGGHQGDIRQWRYTYVLSSIFLLSRSVPNQKSSFKHRIKSYCSIKLGFQLLFHARPTRGGKFSHSSLWSDCCTVFPQEYLIMNAVLN
jgi:hypothetical protein